MSSSIKDKKYSGDDHCLLSVIFDKDFCVLKATTLNHPPYFNTTDISMCIKQGDDIREYLDKYSTYDSHSLLQSIICKPTASTVNIPLFHNITAVLEPIYNIHNIQRFHHISENVPSKYYKLRLQIPKTPSKQMLYNNEETMTVEELLDIFNQHNTNNLITILQTSVLLSETFKGNRHNITTLLKYILMSKQCRQINMRKCVNDSQNILQISIVLDSTIAQSTGSSGRHSMCTYDILQLSQDIASRYRIQHFARKHKTIAILNLQFPICPSSNDNPKTKPNSVNACKWSQACI